MKLTIILLHTRSRLAQIATHRLDLASVSITSADHRGISTTEFVLFSLLNEKKGMERFLIAGRLLIHADGGIRFRSIRDPCHV
jgi:hypothetical protein